MGDLIPFHLLFTETAERETRTVTLLGKRGAPSKTYGLLEAYCPDPTCDCRRVMINVVDVDHLEDGYLAAISFGFDRDADMAGPFLDPLNAQSPLASMLLEHVSVVLSDDAYVKRLERHYGLVKAAAFAHPHLACEAAHAACRRRRGEAVAPQTQGGAQRSVPLRQREEVQELLPSEGYESRGRLT